MFPGAHAQVYYNEAGEPLGWDYPSEPEYDPDIYLSAGDYYDGHENEADDREDEDEEMFKAEGDAAQYPNPELLARVAALNSRYRNQPMWNEAQELLHDVERELRRLYHLTKDRLSSGIETDPNEVYLRSEDPEFHLWDTGDTPFREAIDTDFTEE